MKIGIAASIKPTATNNIPIANKIVKERMISVYTIILGISFTSMIYMKLKISEMAKHPMISPEYFEI
jgi:hypothetical protein